MRHGRRYCPGFTIVELLVVMGIISLLAALLLPALITVGQQAEGRKCVNRLRQVYAGVRFYLNNFKGFLPVAWHVGAEASDDLGHVSYHRFAILESMGSDFSHVVREPVPGSGRGRESAEDKFRICRERWSCSATGSTSDYFAPLIVFRGHRDADGDLDPANTASYDKHAHLSQLGQNVPATERPVLADVNASYPNPEAEDPEDADHEAEMRNGWATHTFNGIDVFLGVGKSLRVAADYDSERFDFRHVGSMNVLFLDSHVIPIHQGDGAALRRLHNRWNKLKPAPGK